MTLGEEDLAAPDVWNEFTACFRRLAGLYQDAGLRSGHWARMLQGMIDENVHFRHTGRLLQKLYEAGIPHETLFFPEERHGPRRHEDRAFLERRVVEFFEQKL